MEFEFTHATPRGADHHCVVKLLSSGKTNQQLKSAGNWHVWEFNDKGLAVKSSTVMSDAELQRYAQGLTTIDHKTPPKSGPLNSIAIAIRGRSDGDCLSEWRQATGLNHRGASVRKPLMAPFFVWDKWEGPIGCKGTVVLPAQTHDSASTTRGLVLAQWRIPVGERANEPVTWLATHVLDRRFTSGRPYEITTTHRACTALERLFDVDEVSGGRFRRFTKHKKDFRPARALRRWGAYVDALEDRFRDGEDLTRDDLIQIEHVQREMTVVEKRFKAVADHVAGHNGMTKRLDRLADSQAARDASGPLTRVLGALTALVLVPTLVAGVYGANVKVPFAGTTEGWAAMLAFMTSGGVLSYAAILGIRSTAKTRGLSFTAPGAPCQRQSDGAWRTAAVIALLSGAALASVANAIDAFLDFRGLDEPKVPLTGPVTTTELALGLSAALLIVLLIRLALRDWKQRSRQHAALIGASAVSGGSLFWAVLAGGSWNLGASSPIWWIMGGAATGGLFAWSTLFKHGQNYLAQDHLQSHRPKPIEDPEAGVA